MTTPLLFTPMRIRELELRNFRKFRQPVRLEDSRDRRASHTMSDILQRALDPRVAPRRIFLRHPYEEPVDLGEDAAPSWPRRVRPFPRDELPMPAQNRIGRDDRRDLSEAPTA